MVEGRSARSARKIVSPRRLLARAGIVLTQLKIPLETISRLAQVCSELDVPLMLDPAPALTLAREVLQRVTWLTPNQAEARTLVPALAGSCDARQTAAALLASGVKNVILKMGEEGS